MSKGYNTAPFWLYDDVTDYFPSVELALAEPNGLLAIGGDLSVERLTAAYKKGIFPWYNEDQPIMWWSPNPRMLLFPNRLKISRSLRKALLKQDFRVTFDTAFMQVIRNCSNPRKDGLGTWLIDDMIQAYCAMHEKGLAHSVEVWSDKELIGGLYGISFGGAFFGESMFSRQSNGSKIALVCLTRQLQQWGFGFIDCQVYTSHLESMGAIETPRPRFIELLNTELKKPDRIGKWKFDDSIQDSWR